MKYFEEKRAKKTKQKKENFLRAVLLLLRGWLDSKQPLVQSI